MMNMSCKIVSPNIFKLKNIRQYAVTPIKPKDQVKTLFFIEKNTERKVNTTAIISIDKLILLKVCFKCKSKVEWCISKEISFSCNHIPIRKVFLICNIIQMSQCCKFAEFISKTEIKQNKL